MSPTLRRTVESSKRITRRNHDCWFPVKSSGIYYGLFATSALPHDLVCDETKTFDKKYIKNWFNKLEKITLKATEKITNLQIDNFTDDDLFSDLRENGFCNVYNTGETNTGQNISGK